MIILICPVHLCVFRCYNDTIYLGLVIFFFSTSVPVAATRYLTSLLHKGQNFTLSCHVTMSLEANVNVAFLKSMEGVRAVVKVLVASSVPMDYILPTPNGASTFGYLAIFTYFQ